ncbi:helix-turn-helix domain-containing protein [Roseateles amylovorans]|uniref:Helix-turn-helix domain-containing protein n=1 Tax=Roseateles amylovorans TaxID=2978473 RepID=A0ABY6B1P8_9BURK|nr:helix-turn-helix domain-containing protein [Roseateles amylovorans]UXH79138.1 helix-turn-helix domain-containing protein [Roseateles amylovorans]
MTDTVRFAEDLGLQLRQRREAMGLSKKDLAERAGKVREVIYRLESGEESTISSLMAVLRALGLTMRLERAGLPTMEEIAERFNRDEDADEDTGGGHAA